MILNTLTQLELALFDLLSKADSTSYPLVECKLKEMESLLTVALSTEDQNQLSVLRTWQCKLAHLWCRYAKVQISSNGSIETFIHDNKVTINEKVEECMQSKNDYSALLSRNNSLLKNILFEDSTDSFDWVFRSYSKQKCNSSSTTKASTSLEASSHQSDISEFFPPASSLVHLSNAELHELNDLMKNSIIEDTVSPEYLQYVTEKLMSELSMVNNSTGYIATLKDLLLVVSKGLNAFAPYRTQAIPYDRHLFATVFRKLTAKERLYYTTNYARDNLQLLSEFFRSEITTFYSAKKRKVYALMAQENGSDCKKLCKYCHEAGHTVKECRTLKKMLCFQCFNFGHSAKKCPQRLKVMLY